MMRVRFTTNLGSIDAARHGLNFQECCKGMECDLGSDAAGLLIKSGLAVDTAPPPVPPVKVPVEIKAVPAATPAVAPVKPKPKPES